MVKPESSSPEPDGVSIALVCREAGDWEFGDGNVGGKEKVGQLGRILGVLELGRFHDCIEAVAMEPEVVG